MARIIRAEQNFVGKQYALSATQVADLQIINTILSMLIEILHNSRGKLISAEISSV